MPTFGSLPSILRLLKVVKVPLTFQTCRPNAVAQSGGPMWWLNLVAQHGWPNMVAHGWPSVVGKCGGPMLNLVA